MTTSTLWLQMTHTRIRAQKFGKGFQRPLPYLRECGYYSAL